jgi:hypothetical protein
VDDRGVQCMLVGYALDHAGDCYRMWNPDTNGIHETRDVIWLRRMFYEKPSTSYEIVDAPVLSDTAEKVVDIMQVGEGTVELDDNEDSNLPDVMPTATRSGRIVQAPIRLIEEINATTTDTYEIKLTEAETNYYAAMKHFGEVACVGAGIGGGFSNTSELHQNPWRSILIEMFHLTSSSLPKST